MFSGTAIAVVSFLYFITTIVGDFNITNLMMIYMNICGEEYLCNEWPGMVGYTVNECHSKCLPCSCDEDCTKNKNCCPDAFFMQRNQHENFISLFLYRSLHEKSLNDVQYATITQCPSYANTTQKEMCEISSYENIERLFPVTSVKSNFTYRNRMCAVCHGENDSDLVRWSIGSRYTMASREISVINMISSFQTLVNLSKIVDHVSVLFVPPENVLSRVYRIESWEYNSESCLSDIDVDIKYACNSAYLKPYRKYKNIFCYVCDFYNYFSHLFNGKKLIDTCKEEFDYSSDFLSIKHACLENPPTVVTYPFKNIYCHICNTYSDITKKCNNFNMSLTWHTSEALSFSVTETFIRFERYWKRRYQLKNLEFRPKKIMEQIANVNVHEKIQNDVNQASHNLTDVVLKLSAVFPERIYNKHLLPSTIQNFPPSHCDNKLSCIFHSQCDCCLDTAFTRPITCLEYFADGIKSKRAPMVVQDCVYSTSFYSTELYLVLRQLCIKDTGTFQSIPVYSNNVTFKNFYCFLCNSNFTITDEQIFMEDYTILPLNIFCDFTLPYFYMTNLSTILEIATLLKCDIDLDTKHISLCYSKQNEMSQCLSGFSYEDDKMWLCNRYTKMNSFTWIQKYAWDFCLDCQHEKRIPFHVDQCSDSRKKEACDLLPTVRNHPLISPYKNIYCKVCTSNCSNCFSRITHDFKQSCEIPKGTGYKEKSDNYRNFFLPSFKSQLNGDIKGMIQEPKVLGCYPGRVLFDDNCKLLLPIAQDLTYVVTVLVYVKVTSMESPPAWTKPLRNSAKLHVESHLGKKIRFFFFLPFNFIGNDIIEFSCYLHMLIHLSDAFDRDAVEKRLLKMHEYVEFAGVISNGTRYEIKGNNLVTTNQAIEEASRVERKLYKDEYERFLKHASDLYSSNSLTIDILHVSNLLFCRHKLFPYIGSEDFVYSKFKMTHIPTKQSFGIGEFVLSIDGRLGICEDKPTIFLNPLNQQLTLLTIVCNCCSVFFLLFLFSTYLAFRTLRTVPGLILMNVVVSLICTQIIFTISNLLERGSSDCVIFGILLHYFWLALSCSQMTCCLHMCQVFALFKRWHSSDFRKTFYYYVTFTYTVPLLLVVLSVSANLFRNSSVGYGINVCFVEDTYSNLLTFVIPVAVSCISSMLLFLTTVGSIFCRTKIQKSKEDVSYVFISLKLFSVTGGVFILTIIDAFLQLSAFSFLTSLLTSLQGVFIFLSFFTSRHVFSLFQSLFERQLTSSSRETSTKLTQQIQQLNRKDSSSDQ